MVQARLKRVLGAEATSMETKDILVIGVWAFAIVLLVGTLASRADLLVALMIFFVAVA